MSIQTGLSLTVCPSDGESIEIGPISLTQVFVSAVGWGVAVIIIRVTSGGEEVGFIAEVSVGVGVGVRFAVFLFFKFDIFK